MLFQTNHAPFLQAATDTFARFPDPETRENPLVVQVMVRKEKNGETSSAPGTHPRLIVHSQRHLVSVTVGGENAGVADLYGGFAFAVLSPQMAQDLTFVRYTFIEALPQILLGGRRYVAVHAACVVKDGVSLLLCAPAGTGKSTLAFACLRRGYQILAEDVVQILLADDGRMRLWGLPWKFHLLPDAVNFFPELGRTYPQIQSNGETKIEVDLTASYPGSTIAQACSGTVVFLQRNEQLPACLSALPTAEARSRFEVIWPWDLPWPSEYDAPLSELLASGAYQLCMGGDLDEAVSLLDELVDRLLA